VLVLNATFEPINVCSVRRAAVLLLKDKAEMLEHAAWELRSEHTAIPRPVVIRLVTFVKVPRDTHRRKITRRAVFARDARATTCPSAPTCTRAGSPPRRARTCSSTSPARRSRRRGDNGCPPRAPWPTRPE
jgi:hypothetical protein